jgi:hypothetical protein
MNFFQKPIRLRKTVSTVENRLPLGVLHRTIIAQRTRFRQYIRAFSTGISFRKIIPLCNYTIACLPEL